ncbi:chemotaxis protein CheW [Xylophilus sp.]|uniref:chemotaxis protein CheW n=1 Tax=Xylophilus sp. TaxID=2653893 RepID=UPI0013BC1F72|nr:chemotaxis protein CheW [Xylophilus sp.]KAF1049774.1 MAG: hypothetical protein GAK38_00437 [Xylophilus sp.]
MANREALRELQSRLAARLQAARSEGLAVSWLAIESAGRRLLLPLAQAGEIFSWTAPHSVPHARPWFLGVANLRGGLYGVADLAGFLAQEAHAPPPAARGEQALAEASLVVFNPALEVNAALLVDRLVGLRGADAFVHARPAAADGSAPAWQGAAYTDREGAAWQEIDLQAVSRHPGFLNIRA